MSSLKITGLCDNEAILKIVKHITALNQHTLSRSVSGPFVVGTPKPLIFRINTLSSSRNIIHQWWNMLPIVQHMQRSRVSVASYVTGRCDNAFLLMLVLSTPGMRYMYEKAELHIDPMISYGGSWQTKASQKDENDNQQRIVDYVKTLLKNTKIPTSLMKKIFWKPVTINAKDAKKYGLIDHVVKQNGEDVHVLLHRETR